MFRFDRQTFTIKDEERKLIVDTRPGPGLGAFAGTLRSPSWTFDFLISRWSDQFAGLSADELLDPNLREQLRRKDYQVQIHVYTYPCIGLWDRTETPLDLARDVALAMESQFYETEPDRISCN